MTGPLLLASIASAQVPTTTALPYVLKCPVAQVCIVASSGGIKPVPPAVASTPFSSLLGGGFGSAFPSPTAAAGLAATIATIHKITVVKNEANAEKWVQQTEFDALNQQTRLENQTPVCANVIAAIKSRHSLTAGPSIIHQLITSDSTCTLPERQAAQEDEEALQELTESEQASQEALEAAEEAAEAAEVAADAAEAAAEATLEGLDVLEGLLDALSLF